MLLASAWLASIRTEALSIDWYARPDIIRSSNGLDLFARSVVANTIWAF